MLVPEHASYKQSCTYREDNPCKKPVARLAACV